MFQEEHPEFNFDLSPQQILSEITDFEFVQTQMFMPKHKDAEEVSPIKFNNIRANLFIYVVIYLLIKNFIGSFIIFKRFYSFIIKC